MKYTKFANLGYKEICNQWSFFDLTTNGLIGPWYAHEADLLSDMKDFASVRGYEEIVFTENQLAFKANPFPCNPIPFLNDLIELVRNNTAAIQSTQAKMLLLTIIQQAYGQLAIVDTYAEFEKLYEIVKRP